MRTGQAVCAVVAIGLMEPGLLSIPTPVEAQFVTPVPLTRDPAVLDTIRYQARFGRYLSKSVRDQIKRGNLDEYFGIKPPE